MEGALRIFPLNLLQTAPVLMEMLMQSHALIRWPCGIPTRGSISFISLVVLVAWAQMHTHALGTFPPPPGRGPHIFSPSLSLELQDGGGSPVLVIRAGLDGKNYQGSSNGASTLSPRGIGAMVQR